MIAAAVCDIGQLRQTNQDYVFASDAPVGPLPNLLIVADGMGGHNAGEMASSITVETILKEVRQETEVPDDPGAFLARLAQDANYEVFKASTENEAWRGMGTTLVAATVVDGWLYAVNVGDSRLYRILKNEVGQTQLIQVTEDHSYVWGLVKAGILTKDEAHVHEKKNLITRAIGQEPDVEVDIFAENMEDTAQLLLCSDGLTDMLDDAEIQRIVSFPGFTPEEIAENLTKHANDNGGKDNISVIIADLRGERQTC